MRTDYRETRRWAYRLFLDREPENDAVLLEPVKDTRSLREAFLNPPEFRERNPDGFAGPDCWVIKESVHGFRIRVSLSELGISRPILRDAYDPNECALLKREITEGDCVYDIGTNIGFYSLLCATLVGPSGRVIGFEPIEYLFQAASSSIRENRFQDFVHINQVAISDTRGTAKIRHAPHTTNFGGGHLVHDSATPPNHIDALVEMRPLDDFPNERSVRLIKIDVEGAEPRVIQGAGALLRRDRPLILAELHNAQLAKVSASSATAFIATMRSNGYACTRIDTLSEIHSYDLDDPINVLFRPV